MVTVGLTGGIASGKSSVARMLQEKGALLLDADVIAREAVLPGAPAWREIVEWLGRSFLQADGYLDRDRLGRLVFADAAARSRLNSIVHPRVGEEILARTAQIKSANPDAVLVYDIPLLIEAGMRQMVDLVLLVYVTPAVQLRRLRRRDKFSREEALNRINAQMSLDHKKRCADYIIDNSGSRRDTERQVSDFWRSLCRER